MDELKRFDKLKVYITGFGAFGNVLNNPTTHLVNRIKEMKSQIEEMFIFDIHSADILRVTISDASKYCEDLHKKLSSEGEKNTMHLAIHFGVAASRDKICLEIVAKNMFNGTDVDGIKMDGLINKECGDTHISRLDLNNICNLLKSTDYENILELSDDAGAYLCNYIYFYNENKCKSHNYENVFCVFIHVPLFEIVNEETQFNFFLDFIKVVKDIYIKI